jgi:ribosomal protein S27AE
MKTIRHELLERCPACGIALLAGPIFFDVEAAMRRLGLSKVAFLDDKADLAICDGVYIGDLISKEGTLCPRCGASPFVAVEIEQAETCALCASTPAIWWGFRDCSVGLCHACFQTPEGKAWVDSLSDRLGEHSKEPKP